MNTARSPKHYDLLGVRVDALDMSAAAELITARAADPKQPASYVVKPYVEFLDQGHRDEHVRALLNNAWLSLPDSVSTQWAAAYLYGGKPSWWRVMSLGIGIMVYPRVIRRQIPEKFGGTTFAWKLLEDCAARRLRIYLIGSPVQSDISVAAKAIRQRLPELEVVGTWPGHLKGKSGEGLRKALQRGAIEQELVEDLRETKPDIILVGMSFPLQVELMVKLMPQLTHGVLIGEGGTFDYASFGGVRTKAPRILQQIGLEWLWRLILEPSRWRRQLAIPRFVWAVYQSSRTRPGNTR